MIDFQVAFDKLAQFQTANELAKFFQYEGIKAIPGSTKHCAISVWMRRTIEKELVYTNPFTVAEYKGTKLVAVNMAKTTSPMLDFIVAFDRGNYPALVQE